MAEAKTKQTTASVPAFLSGIEDPARRKVCQTLVKLMKEASGHDAKMWGPSIVGFGTKHYKYESGHEGDTCILGFSPRKAALTLYLSGGLAPLEPLLGQLGKHTTGKGCLYIKKLADVDLDVLKEMLAKSARSV